MRCVTSTVCCLFGALITGCASSEDYSRSRAEREAEFMLPFEDLDGQKAALWELGFEPQNFEFEGQGKVTVSDWSLTGWPGSVFVNARVRYVNTTDKPMTGAVVWLEILDSEDLVQGSAGVRMINPMGYPVWPGGSITLEVRAPTNDAHHDPKGWQWGVACTAEPALNPGPKPQMVVMRDRGSDGQVRDPRDGVVGRSWTWSAPTSRRQAPQWSPPRRNTSHTPGVNYWDR